ncbi:hypothetical protein BCR33DRAFT_725140 [Rhizoclosmatium globosum]|uniref:Uncharacterized protein n=1 Tax=Rhizoclosmatium globosum TaxID=329046 RepID=A0A1Y2B121_9FUNG|nr:hypothetical protein BCR33DRAFT_725140 [Rhizoclosmatium globosum]|eukprot:ORY28436.1 hypothetical protein BCR33DRAFT_725140 [Rhizoclosmatium globosum]
MTTTAPRETIELWVQLKSNTPGAVNQAVLVSTQNCRFVTHFIDAIKQKLHNKLIHVDPDNITLHTTEDSPALETDDPLPAQNTKQTALIVKPQHLYSSRSSQGGPHPKRLKLWDKLNTDFALAGIATNDGFTPFLSITWNIVEDTFRPVYVKYQQDLKPIPDDKFNILVEWLSTIYKCLGTQLTGSSSNNEAKRIHLIAPIIWVVASLLDGVTVDVERTIRGRRIKANGKFEFMLERQNKRICIVAAKKQDLDQGLAQNLVGCEVVSDLDDTHEVYGIVTTFEKWIFLKSLDGKILFDENSNLSFDSDGVPDRAQLKNVVGKTYHLLL